MKKETEIWLKYADENIRSAQILMDSGIYNPSLQNSQQAIEKLLKAVLIEKATGLTRTHNIRELVGYLEAINIHPAITDDDIDLIDSIYLPSKYPAFSVLPYFMPDEDICGHCLSVARDVYESILTAIR